MSVYKKERGKEEGGRRKKEREGGSRGGREGEKEREEERIAYYLCTHTLAHSSNAYKLIRTNCFSSHPLGPLVADNLPIKKNFGC